MGKGLLHRWQVGLMLVVSRVQIGLNRIRHSKLGFAYPVVDTNAQCIMKGPEQKIVYQWPLYQGTHFHLQSNDLIENWNGQWNTCLKGEEIKTWRAVLLIHLHWYVIILNMRESKGWSPLDRFLYFSGEERVRGGCSYDILFTLGHYFPRPPFYLNFPPYQM